VGVQACAHKPEQDLLSRGDGIDGRVDGVQGRVGVRFSVDEGILGRPVGTAGNGFPVPVVSIGDGLLNDRVDFVKKHHQLLVVGNSRVGLARSRVFHYGEHKPHLDLLGRVGAAREKVGPRPEVIPPVAADPARSRRLVAEGSHPGRIVLRRSRSRVGHRRVSFGPNGAGVVGEYLAEDVHRGLLGKLVGEAHRHPVLGGGHHQGGARDLHHVVSRGHRAVFVRGHQGISPGRDHHSVGHGEIHRGRPQVKGDIRVGRRGRNGQEKQGQNPAPHSSFAGFSVHHGFLPSSSRTDSKESERSGVQ